MKTTTEMLAELNAGMTIKYNLARTRSGSQIHMQLGGSGSSLCGVRRVSATVANVDPSRLCEKCFAGWTSFAPAREACAK